MGVWDAFTGRKATAASTGSPDILPNPVGGGDSSVQTSFDSIRSDDVSSFINTPGAFDPAALHPLAGLDKDSLDYLNLDDSALSDLPGSRSLIPSRGWSDDLCYGTGTTYLSALVIGGVWGGYEGYHRLPATSPPKLLLNGTLNGMTRRGPFFGNSAGIIAMMYNGINSTIGYWRGKHDAANSVAAGTISGMIFKSTRGVRPMLISGALVGSVAGAWALVRDVYLDDD